MQTWANKSFARLVVLVFLFTIAVIPSSPAAQAAPVEQAGSC